MSSVLTKTDFSDLKLSSQGKVRDVYDLGEYLLIVTTDRVSAFDVVLPVGVPNKGYVLTKLSEFWFSKTKHIIDNHFITSDINKMPSEVLQYKELLEGRSMLVKKCKPLPVECIVRGYITGSGWKSYLRDGSICGIVLPEGLKESEKLSPALYTPTSKADIGDHDEDISFEETVKLIGEKNAERVKEASLGLYTYGEQFSKTKGIILADTKFEFGIYNDEVILIDEALTPDSSRYWSVDSYTIGQGQPSLDKQIIRDYLLNKENKDDLSLSQEIVEKTSNKYLEILKILTN